MLCGYCIYSATTDLLEGVGEVSTLGGGAPAGDGAHGSLVVLGSSAGESNGGNMGAHGGGALKLQQADVVQDVEGVIVLVEDDLGDLDVLLVGVHAVQLVGADGNAQTVGGLSAI